MGWPNLVIISIERERQQVQSRRGCEEGSRGRRAGWEEGRKPEPRRTDGGPQALSGAPSLLRAQGLSLDFHSGSLESQVFKTCL